jgi:protoporphyrinogen oxidase
VKVETLIVGGGVSGLATAAALGPQADFLVLERDTELGGYCKTVKLSGFTWDYSGHFFHFRHPSIEAWLKQRMGDQVIRTITKKSFIRYAGRDIDFPFQKNIHQLPPDEFHECVRGLEEAERLAARGPFGSFRQMLTAGYGAGICEKFLIPYNEKLYATDLDRLEPAAMGRFFPHATPREILKNAKQPDNRGYNDTFTYPEGGAIEYVYALANALPRQKIRLGETLVSIDLAHKTARTSKGEYQFERLVSSAPFPRLLEACGLTPPPGVFTSNKVLVFNLGFSAKGPAGVHWMYFPDRALPFYRVGFYDNIFEGDRMSLYVELGFPSEAKLNVKQLTEDVLAGLRAERLLTTQSLVAAHHVVMDPAYVHITEASARARQELGAQLQHSGVHSIGRYGGWTYCSIEDNIVEANALAKSFGAKGSFGL